MEGEPPHVDVRPFFKQYLEAAGNVLPRDLARIGVDPLLKFYNLWIFVRSIGGLRVVNVLPVLDHIACHSPRLLLLGSPTTYEHEERILLLQRISSLLRGFRQIQPLKLRILLLLCGRGGLGLRWSRWGCRGRSWRRQPPFRVGDRRVKSSRLGCLIGGHFLSGTPNQSLVKWDLEIGSSRLVDNAPRSYFNPATFFKSTPLASAMTVFSISGSPRSFFLMSSIRLRFSSCCLITSCLALLTS